MEKITDRTPAEALNDNLKGLYMGRDIFDRYAKKCKSQDLKRLLMEIITLYEKEALEISNKIVSLGEKPSSNVGIIGKTSEILYNLKTVAADTDSEILEESIKAHKTGIMMFQKFLSEKGDALDKDSKNLIKNMLKENEDISQKLNDFSNLNKSN
ncbi:DUF2383 domain-containing protein [Clostridium sp. B9]|uniref:DUF2383 domain-containing protein n=1 Tax=Clostridium sp. B9 TaxID=3423224 RepID=UPI003D2EE5F6